MSKKNFQTPLPPPSPSPSLRGRFGSSLRGHFLLSTLPVVARSLLAILTKQSPCHYPHPVIARSLWFVVARSLLAIPPPRRCEVSSCYPHEAISVPPSPSRHCEVTSYYTHEAISVTLSLAPSLRGRFGSSLRGHFLLTPLPVVARSLLAILTKQSPCHHPHPVVARSLLAIPPKQSPCHSPLS